MAPVTLYMVKISPTCRVVWLYLLQNGIEHETIDITCIDDIQKLSHMDKLSGHTDVPILTDGSVVVFEAPAILEYLGKHYTNYAGFGKTVTTQSKCSSMLSWTNSEVHRIAGYMFAYPQFLDKYRLDSDSANENLIENGIQNLTSKLNRIEESYLKKSRYLCGNQLTIADSFLVTTLMQSQWAGFNFAIWPKVRAWLRNVADQPYWKLVHETHDEFLEEIALNIV